MKLLDLKQGDTAVIDKLNGDKNTSARMSGFGIRKGKQIRMIKAAPFNGPLLVEDVSSGARMMISREMASHVEVSCSKTQ
ncbi:MAG: FeoA family protein [Desulfomonilia bacterium]